MAIQIGMPWHDGELRAHAKIGSPEMDNPTHATLSQQGAFMLQQAPLLAMGTLDNDGRPWTTIWGGEPGFAQPLGASMVGIKTHIDNQFDPVIQILCGRSGDSSDHGNVQQMAGKPMGGLTIDLDRRKRVKLAGKMVAGAVAVPETAGESKPQAQIQLVTQINQSLGNCPKYLNRKDIKPASVDSLLLSDSPALSEQAAKLILKSDLFFISSTYASIDMDTNHRGGPPGFTRVSKDEDGNSVIVWPEYSGNRLYQTLGNLETTPLAGLVFPDFDSGDVLYVTGKTETLIGRDANSVLPRSKLAVSLTVTGARLVQRGLPFRGLPIEQSPYNPRLRTLAKENHLSFEQGRGAPNSVKLVKQTPITPTISRFTFSMNNPASYNVGQWVALDFSDELDIGYSHMRDDDPTSLNDDFIRTFTVSSPPPPREDLADDNFEITARRVGNVTAFLFRQSARTSLEIPMRGFGGDFTIQQTDQGITPFIAGGVGITPVLAFLPKLDLTRFKLFWTLHIDDVDLVIDTVTRYPPIAPALEIFFTGVKGNRAAETLSLPLANSHAKIKYRRLRQEDLEAPEFGDTWHICVGTSLRKSILEWLKGQSIIFEDFNF